MAGAGWWVVRGSVAQLWDQLRWVGVGEGGENIPALLTGGLDDGAQGGEALCALGGAGAAGDFLTQLDHPEISLGLVVCEGDLSRLVEEVQALCLSFLEAERAVVAGPSLGPSVFYGREWWEALVEGEENMEGPASAWLPWVSVPVSGDARATCDVVSRKKRRPAP